MPTTSMFFGIMLRMYLLDDKQRNLLHIHVVYAEYKATISIIDGAVLGGHLPRQQVKLVRAWIEIQADELSADRTLAVSVQAPYRIKPLR